MVKDKTILQQVNGKWVIKQIATSKQNAEKALRLLNSVKHGWKPNNKHIKTEK